MFSLCVRWIVVERGRTLVTGEREGCTLLIDETCFVVSVNSIFDGVDVTRARWAYQLRCSERQNKVHSTPMNGDNQAE